MKKVFTILGVVAMGACAFAQTNLIVNPGFENWTEGKPDGWLTLPASYAQESTVKHGGDYSVVVTSAGSTQTLGATDIDVTAGVEYTYSGWYLDNDPSARMRYWGQWRDANGAMTAEVGMQQSDFSTDASVWKQFSVTAPAPAGALKMRASVRAYKDENGSSGGKVYFDDIYFGQKSLGTIDIKAFDSQVKMNTLVKNDLTLRLPSRATVNVYSVDGKLMSSNRLNDGDTINMSSYAKGMYVVSVQDNNGNKISRKVIKD